MEDKTVIMKQISRYKWCLIAPKGYILADDLYLQNDYIAENWVKAYVSSHQDWAYIMQRKQVTKE